MPYRLIGYNAPTRGLWPNAGGYGGELTGDRFMFPQTG